MNSKTIQSKASNKTEWKQKKTPANHIEAQLLQFQNNTAKEIHPIAEDKRNGSRCLLQKNGERGVCALSTPREDKYQPKTLHQGKHPAKTNVKWTERFIPNNTKLN